MTARGDERLPADSPVRIPGTLALRRRGPVQHGGVGVAASAGRPASAPGSERRDVRADGRERVRRVRLVVGEMDEPVVRDRL